MLERELKKTLLKLAKGYPVLAITGPRQSGKTTLARWTFPKLDYVSLESPVNLEFAQNDPRGFLIRYNKGAVIDEAQRCPDLFSYLQEVVDLNRKMGKFVLTGSQQFNLLSKITQSLAGRVGMLELLPFSQHEISRAKKKMTLDETLFKGFYPPLYDRTLDPRIWCEDYVKTYVERDVRQLINIKDLATFQLFLRLCAARTAQMINLTELGNSCGIDVRTVKSWLSILQASYIIHLLKPHQKNFSKRLVKTPKLYFFDTGLVCYLLGIHRAQDVEIHSMKGHLFETMVMGEFLKYSKNRRQPLTINFWRNHKGVEIDILIEEKEKLFPIEIKSGQTVHSSFLNNLKQYAKLAGSEVGTLSLITGGEECYKRESVDIVSWSKIFSLYSKIFKLQ